MPGEVSRFKDLLPWCEGQGSFYPLQKISRLNQRHFVLPVRIRQRHRLRAWPVTSNPVQGLGLPSMRIQMKNRTPTGTMITNSWAITKRCTSGAMSVPAESYHRSSRRQGNDTTHPEPVLTSEQPFGRGGPTQSSGGHQCGQAQQQKRWDQQRQQSLHEHLGSQSANQSGISCDHRENRMQRMPAKANRKALLTPMAIKTTLSDRA